MKKQKSFKYLLKYFVPVWLKKALKYTIYSCEDFVNFIMRKKSEYPPRRLNFVGSGDFANVGNEFMRHFKEVGHVKPTDAVLDIGCGIGRMAIPFTKFLNEDGRYFGFDIDKRGIDWCSKNISRKHPNFYFEYVDLFNKYYNKKGLIKAKEFVFPYADSFFDFIFATSVFTHMLSEDVSRYLSEVSRVLKPSGTALLTFFSIDKQASENIKTGVSRCDFRFSDNEHCFYSHKDVKEAETAYAEHWILNQLKKFNLDSDLQIFHGSWSGRTGTLSYQDIFVCRKK